MHAYECWHYLCRDTVTVVWAISLAAALREVAAMFGCSARDIVGREIEQ